MKPGGGTRVRGGETPVRVGVFGLLGSGNLGNDGSLEAVLGYLRADHPDAAVDALCGGPEVVATRYRIPATRLHWYRGSTGPRHAWARSWGKGSANSSTSSAPPPGCAGTTW